MGGSDVMMVMGDYEEGSFHHEWYHHGDDNSRYLSKDAKMEKELFELGTLFLFMVGISSTLEFNDIKQALLKPKPIMIGLATQYLVLPPLAYGISSAFNLQTPYFVGLVAITSCPGGTLSNILCTAFRANMALSVSLTAVSSILAFLFLPMNLHLYLSAYSDTIHIKPWDISKSTLVVVGGTAMGLLCEYKLKGKALAAVRNVGTIAGIVLLVKAIVDNAKSKVPVWNVPVEVPIAAAMPMVFGHLFGAIIARLFKLEPQSCVAIALEVSIQNKMLALGVVSSILEPDEADIAKAVPLMYAMFASIFNSVLLILYWKLGFTNLNPQSPWYSPLKNLSLHSVMEPSSKVSPAPVIVKGAVNKTQEKQEQQRQNEDAQLEQNEDQSSS